jgi:hypothetical protein
MHLGFHIYDVGFQSPNVEAARPLVFATAFICHWYNHAAMPVAYSSKHFAWLFTAIFHAFLMLYQHNSLQKAHYML